MKKIHSASAGYFNVMNEKAKKLSIIFFSITVVFIFILPAVLQAQKTIDIQIIDKQYVAPATTPKIPQEFKAQGAGFVVRAGDMIRICNNDQIFAKPFSFNKPNNFGGVAGSGLLRPGNCMSLTVKNPTNKPVIFWLYDEIHNNEQLGLVVLPKDWPDEGEESTPRVARKDNTDQFRTDNKEGNTVSPPMIPDVINECEEGICGTWTKQGNTFNAVWSNGAKATLSIQKFDGRDVIITRKDVAASVSQNFNANYSGKISGHQVVDGKVKWSQNGREWSGKWTASWYARLRPFPPTVFSQQRLPEGTLRDLTTQRPLSRDVAEKMRPSPCSTIP